MTFKIFFWLTMFISVISFCGTFYYFAKYTTEYIEEVIRASITGFVLGLLWVLSLPILGVGLGALFAFKKLRGAE